MKTNDLRFTVKKLNINYNGEKADIIIKMSLNDKCKNGHQDFSVTGSIYVAGKRGDRNMIVSGAISDEAAKYFPEYKVICGLHLCDYNGAPMYTAVNMFYHLKNGFNRTKINDKNFGAEFTEYYRITPEQYKVISLSEDEKVLSYYLGSLGIIEQWKKEAKEAINILEDLTGDTFLNDSTKQNFKPLNDDDKKLIEQRLKVGYYSVDNIKERKSQAEKQAKIDKIKDIKRNYEKTVSKAKDKMFVMIAVVKVIGNTSNVIYYNHSNTLAFNWQTSPYEHEYSEKEFNSIVKRLKKYKTLPEGIKFKLK